MIGAGPAGAALAVDLARSGVAVHVVDGGPPLPSVEGYSRHTLHWLERGALHAAAAAVSPPVPRTGRWGDRSVSGAEHLANRAALHAALREDLAAAGVVVHRGRGPVAASAARVIVYAVGRRGRATTGPALLAVTGAMPAAVGDPRTVVGTWSGGWFWIAVDETATQLQIVGRPRDGRPADWFRRFADEHPAWADLAAWAHGRFAARAAHARLTTDPDPLRRAGDAALAVDPLSGHGVYEALRSVPAQAAAVRCVLAGDRHGLGARFLAARRQETWVRTLETATAFYAEQDVIGGFWRDTATGYRNLRADQATEIPRKVRIEYRPVLEFGYIREREVVVTPQQPRGVWQVDGVPVLTLRDVLRQTLSADPWANAVERLQRPLPAIRRAAAWLQSVGLLEESRGPE